MATPPTLLTLPPEIRDIIYTYLLSPRAFKLPDNNQDPTEGRQGYRFDLRLLRTCRQVYDEAREIFRLLNVFVAIETPLPEAETHVRVEGHVPLAIRGERARLFTTPHLAVRIAFAHETLPDLAPQRFCVLKEDLPAFCQVWFYSDLGNPGLNELLRMRLELRDPYASAAVCPHADCGLPAALQRQLLQPFGRVKELERVDVDGPRDAAVEQAMRDEMAMPPLSAEKCLEEGNRLKEAGNTALQAGKYREAIKLYERSFLAIHVVCDGRRRTVWADRFFQHELTSGEYHGQHALLVRAMLRCRLVANIVLAYVKLGDFAEAHFWGNRTIHLIQGGGTGPVDHGPDFAAAKEFGKIYYRTALAAKALGDPSEARRHLAVAIKYLPNDAVVQKELQSLVLPLV